MGSGASSGLSAAVAAASEEGLASVLAEVSADQRSRLQAALEATEGAKSSAAVETLEVCVSTLSGEVVGELAMPLTAVAAQLKRWLSERDDARTPVSRLCLLLGQQIVSDTDVLNDLVPAGSPGKLALHLVRKHRTVARAAAPPSGEEPGLLFKLVLVGDIGVGKSSVVTRFVDDSFMQSTKTTIGVDFKTTNLLVDDTTHVKLQIWDMSGNERFRTIVQSYFRGASCILVVFDTTSRDSFKHLPNYLKDAEKYGNAEALISIVGNKADLLGSREVSEEEAAAFAANLGLTYYGVSAKSGDGIKAPFYDHCRALVDRRESIRGR